MTLNDPLANVLSHIFMEDARGKQSVIVKPVSKSITQVLNLLKENTYIGDFNVVDNGRGGEIQVQLLGAVNKCGVIKPRYSARVEEYLKYEQRFLPAHGFGLLIVSTNKGMMTHIQAQKENLGGKLIAYVY